jgi:hypothetical protein
MTLWAALLAAPLLLAQDARAQAPPPAAETIAIPLLEKRLLGAPRALSLEAFLYRPASIGPLPVLVFERYDCDRAILTAGVERAVENLDAVLAVVYPSRRAVTARGVVSFAGGWTVERCEGRTRFNEDTFTEAGRTARLPMLRLDSENDRNYGPASVGTSCCRAKSARGGPRRANS